ncbi:Kinesin-1 [Striga hermonthica]|uniref:Kinesin-1 n=1 Tax=Striga hermonthica TaxID=68872 RepID=A0A9N7R7X6_STRHE|nr:Kinesin-1 [Striga hermonthica]
MRSAGRIYTRLSKFSVLPPVVLDFSQSEKLEIVANVKKYLQFFHLEYYPKLELEAYTNLTFEFYTTFKFVKNGTDVVCRLGDKRKTIDTALMHQIFGFVSTGAEAPTNGLIVASIQTSDRFSPSFGMLVAALTRHFKSPMREEDVVEAQRLVIKYFCAERNGSTEAEDTDLRGMVKEIVARMEFLMEALGGEVATLRLDLQQVQDEVATYKEWIGKSIPELHSWQTKATESTCLSQSEQIRRLQKQLAVSKELKGNIRVFCRVRPFLSDDGVGNNAKVVSFPTSPEHWDEALIWHTTGKSFLSLSIKCSCPMLLRKMFLWRSHSLFRVHLMAIRGLHGYMVRQAQGWKYDMRISMLEIYNETIRDLLAPNRTCSDASRAENAGKQYAIKHDANGNTQVFDLTVVDVQSSKEVSYLLERAAQSRSVGKTQMNEQSSRSHFVFTLRIMGFNENTDQQVCVLNLIDLAGSERLSKSGSTGNQLKETQAINKSLSSLSDVIFALAKKEEHVPYRNSKLTYLLQPCLGGDSKTLMFVNVSPDHSLEGESLCSLRFAARVNACEIGVPRRQTNLRS